MIILDRGCRNQRIIILIVPEPCAIYMAKWEIIAREFLTVAYISMNTYCWIIVLDTLRKSIV